MMTRSSPRAVNAVLIPAFSASLMPSCTPAPCFAASAGMCLSTAVHNSPSHHPHHHHHSRSHFSSSSSSFLSVTPSFTSTNSALLAAAPFVLNRPFLPVTTRPCYMTTTPTPTPPPDGGGGGGGGSTATATDSPTKTSFVPPFEQEANLPSASDDRLELPVDLPKPPALSVLGHTMTLTQRGAWGNFLLRLRLLKQLRGRLRKGTVLTARLGGALPDRMSPSARLLSSSSSMPTFSILMRAIRCAAHDPRITHLHLRIDALTCGWAKILELRRHIDLFASAPGKKGVTAYIEAGGPKELFLAAGYALYVPPQGDISLRGFMASGSFVRGVLDNVGIDPQVERIGAYKSAGDQLARTTMSPEQRETLTAIIQDISETWTDGVCQATGISRDDLQQLVDQAPYNMRTLVDAGLITGMCYETQLIDALKLRYSSKSPVSPSDKKADDIIKKPLVCVDVNKYARRATPRLLGLTGRKRIAVIRVAGPITSGRNSSSPVTGPSVGSETLIELLRRARDDKRVAGVLIRCDSPGGGALASDLVWHEVRALRAVKPVVASQGDVAASGGYYISMAAGDIVSEALTLTGSVGVVAAKPSLGSLYNRVGFSREHVSTGGQYAQLLVDDRPFSPEEQAYFKKSVRYAYDTFVEKAAKSRGKSMDDMDSLAQGRVWTGKQAFERGLIDHIGGMEKAIEVLKSRCEIAPDVPVRVDELTPPTSLAERLGLSSASAAGIGGGLGAQTSMAESLLDGATPLAIADVDVDLAGGNASGMAPLSKLVLDVVVTRLVRAAPFLAETGQLQVLADRFIEAVTTGRRE